MGDTLKITGYALTYPTAISKIRQRLRDIPWKFSEYLDSVLPGEFARLHDKVRPYTMINYPRLRGLYKAVRHAALRDIEGDIVECGAARGGSAALMGLVIKQYQANKTLWVFDNFEGLPEPTLNDPDYENAKRFTGTCRGELEEVRALFEAFGILSQTKLIKGLFEKTLPECEIKSISILHIDGDWYESVKVCLETLYERISPGGIVQIDDYGQWAGAGKAVDEFMHKYSVNSPLRYLDDAGRQFVKPLTR